MSEAIKAGDVVRLKSGGPGMTVTDVTIHGVTASALCACWRDGGPDLAGPFPVVALELVGQGAQETGARRNCRNCRHQNVAWDDTPCSDCRHSRWEPDGVIR
jgi:uncharacterized protein YodC (DUF2158 family)